MECFEVSEKIARSTAGRWRNGTGPPIINEGTRRTHAAARFAGWGVIDRAQRSKGLAGSGGRGASPGRDTGDVSVTPCSGSPPGHAHEGHAFFDDQFRRPDVPEQFALSF